HPSCAADATRQVIPEHAHECKAPGTPAARLPRKDRASRKTEILSNKQSPLADNRMRTPAAKLQRTARALALAMFPLQATRPIPIRRPCQSRKELEKSAARCNSAKTL